MQSVVSIIWFSTENLARTFNGTVTRLWARQPRNLGSIPSIGRRFSVLDITQISSGAHPASYTMGTKVHFPEGKAAGA
jgi:hypothetical protein